MSQMDNNESDELRLKEILVDLEAEHKHLQVSIDHLDQEVKKREIEIEKLLADRELALAKANPDLRTLPKALLETQPKDQSNKVEVEHSSEFVREVNHLFNVIARKTEEISSLMKL